MKKRSLWSRVLTLLLVVCMLMNDQSTSLFVEAVSAAALQPEKKTPCSQEMARQVKKSRGR